MRAPIAKALRPLKISAAGYGAIYPIFPDLLIVPAIIPLKKRGSWILPKYVLTCLNECKNEQFKKLHSGLSIATFRVGFIRAGVVVKIILQPSSTNCCSIGAASLLSGKLNFETVVTSSFKVSSRCTRPNSWE